MKGLLNSEMILILIMIYIPACFQVKYRIVMIFCSIMESKFCFGKYTSGIVMPTKMQNYNTMERQSIKTTLFFM